MCWLRRTKYSFLTFEKTVWDEMIRDERRDDTIWDVTKESHWDMGREVPNETLNYEKEERRYEYDIRRSVSKKGLAAIVELHKLDPFSNYISLKNGWNSLRIS